MAGLSSTGLEIKRLQDIRDEITARLETFFGLDINTTEDSVFGQLRDSVAPGESSLWEELQIVYDSQFPSRAEGQQLDDNVGIVGVVRDPAATSTVRASVTGVNNTALPAGFTVAVSTTGDEFEIVTPVSLTEFETTSTIVNIDVVADITNYTITLDTINASFTSGASATAAEIVAGLIVEVDLLGSQTGATTSNPSEILITSNDPLDFYDIEIDPNMSFVSVTALIPMQSKVKAPIVAPIDLLTDIRSFISGISSVTNKEEATLGRVEETDPELRDRREQELSIRGSSSVNAIFDRITEVPNVNSVVVLENFTNSTDGNGLIPHSILAIVDGGDDTAIAQAIFDTKPVGTDMNGSEAVLITDSMGVQIQVLFDRPTAIPIFLKITLTTFSEYPDDGDTQIKNALVAFFLENFSAGEDVITSRLYEPINSVEGHQVDSIFIDDSPTPTIFQASITITLTEIATLDFADIEIV